METVLKRYLLFAGYDYYPAGGWADLEGQFDTLEEAQTAGKKADGQWYQVIDITTGLEVVSV